MSVKYLFSETKGKETKMQKLLAIVAVLVLASAAFAGSSATPYRYSLPGETVVYSTDFSGISVADWSTKTAPDANVGQAGYWTANATGIFGGANNDMVLVRGLIGGTNPEPKATYTLATPINVKDGPVSLYWTMACANGTVATPGDFYMAGGVSDSRGSGPGGLSGFTIDPNTPFDGAWREPTHHRIGTQIWGSYGAGPAGMTQEWWDTIVVDPADPMTDPNYPADPNYWTLPGVYQGGVNDSEGSADIMVTSDVQPPLTAYQLNGEPVQYKLVGHQGEAGKMVMQLHYGFEKTGVFSWQPLGPEWDAHTSGDFLMGIDETDPRDGIPEAQGVLKNIWMFTSPWVGGGVIIDDVELTQAVMGNTDSDDDVDGDDYFNVVNNFGATAANNEAFPAGALVDTAGVPNLIYDPATGNVQIDKDGGDFDTYQIRTFLDADFNEAACIQPFTAAYALTTHDLTPFETFESGALGAYLAGAGPYDLGNILPTGWDLATLSSHLDVARWSLGTGLSGTFDLIPEPATMILLGIGGLGVMLKRRRA